MDVTVLKRSIFLKTIVLFVLFYYFFLYCLLCVKNGQSFLSLHFLKSYIVEHFILTSLVLVTAFTLYKGKAFSKIAYFCFCFIALFLLIEMYYESSNKLILMLGFSAILISSIFYICLVSEFEESIYNPRFTPHDLYLNTLGAMTCELTLANGQTLNAELTNWSLSSCFLYTGKFLINKKQKISLKINFFKKSFNLVGHVATINERGIGIILESFHLSQEWRNLLIVLKDRGHVVED